MNGTTCNLKDCYWNTGSVCSRPVTILHNGMCNFVYQNGRVKDLSFWHSALYKPEP